jgi:predicted nucleic acid-binding Zn ribbon protein
MIKKNNHSISRSFSKTPAGVQDILGSLLQNKKIKEKAKSFAFITQWSSLVGDEMARISKPEKLSKGLLTVRVIDAVYAQELSMKKAEYLEKLVELGYSGAVTDIQFISGNPKNFRE